MHDDESLDSAFARGSFDGPADEDILIAEEVASLLRVKVTWVYAEKRANRIPHMRLGRYCRYRRSTIEHWLIEQEQQTAKRRRG
ncbi:MAG: DNA-binding protein [Conexibacter sp.]|nr:DNA-binding protein [Solirubrobacterales bacterium]MCW3002366.1 DNA-binding protein [Conexibacter sp.]